MSRTPQVPVKLSVAEQGKLRGLPYFVRCLYILAIRPYMDMETGVVGLRSQISYGSLAADMYVEPHQGEQDSGTPTTSRIKRGVQRLIKADLIENRSVSTPTYKRLVFFCPSADTGKFVRKKPGPNSDHSPEPQPGPLPEYEEPSNYAVSEGDHQEEPGPLPEPPENAKPGSHPESGKRRNTTTTTIDTLKQRVGDLSAACGGGGGDDEKEKNPNPLPPGPSVQRHMGMLGEVGHKPAFPKPLTARERELAARLLAGIDRPVQQQMLDVLAMAMEAAEIRKTPLDYLQGLIRRYREGSFDPTPGLPIAEKRHPIQTQRHGEGAHIQAAERAMDERLREYERLRSGQPP